MADSDSDDELMNRLTKSVMAHHQRPEDCDYCGQPHATTLCTICHSTYYCNETCLRRNAKAHRAFCITARMQQKEDSESDDDSSDEDESDSDTELVGTGAGTLTRSLSRSRSSSSASVASTNRRSSQRSHSPMNTLHVPGLTDAQIQRLLELSTKSDKLADARVLDQLQLQIAQLVDAQSKASATAAVRDRAGSSAAGSGGVKLKDIKDLQLKLQELEQKTQSLSATSGNSNAPPPIYSPLLVRDDPALSKYFKLKDMAMPPEQIQAKMEGDGVDPLLLDQPDEISPNDPGPAPGAYVPLTVKRDPAFRKYFKLKALNMPLEQIKLKMQADGVDSSVLDRPTSVSPNDPGPPPTVRPSSVDPFSSMRLSGGAFGAVPTTTSAASSLLPYVPLLIKDDEAFRKYFKLQQMGMPREQIQLKMQADSVDPSVLDRPDDVSPNDPGPPVAPASDSAMTTHPPVSMEQLFSILMQHQQIIQNVSNGTSSLHQTTGGASGASMSATSAASPVRSVEDQMARELADAESALDDLFGTADDAANRASGSSGGMSLIEQLEKKARRESNKKLVEKRTDVNALIQQVLTTQCATDDDAIAFYNNIAPQLEALGLSLGVDANQTWSSRLLIKNKDTREWYYSEQERLDAGRAYMRLWSLSFLERDAGQLIAKRQQLVNAPATLRASVKSKAELIDKFTALLKDAVKLKHKVFKNSLFAVEMRRLKEQGLPEQMDARGTALVDAAAVLAAAALDLVDDELRALDATTRAKKIRALTAINVGDKALTFVGIVQKVGANGVDEARVAAVDAAVQALKASYVGKGGAGDGSGGGGAEADDEDDVL